MLIEPTLAKASIVLVGNFSPAIFTPDWFVRFDLINENEILRDAPESVITSKISQIQLEWCQITVDGTRFNISTSMDPVIRIADLVVRTFGEFLPHTPLRKLGINREVHFPVASKAVRDKVGYRLAPPEAWGEWATCIRAGSGERHGGMKSLSMGQVVFDTNRTGSISATVQPSSQFEDKNGIFMLVNDHYEAVNADGSDASDGYLLRVIAERFESSIKYSEYIIDQIMKLSNELR